MAINNKKKTGSTKRKEAAAKMAAGDAQAAGPEMAPLFPHPSESNKEPMVYNRSQLIAVVFFAMGASRFMEWHRALYEMIGPAAFDANNTATTVCQTYILTNDEVDYDSVCNSPVTATMVSLKYDVSCQMLLLVLFMMVQCWTDETMMSRLNAVLTLTPVSTTLLLLQACNEYITPRRSKFMTIASAILMFMAFPATGSVLRELRESWKNKSATSYNGIIIFLCLASMTALQFYEMWQWSETANQTSSNILVPSVLSDWNEAWKVFMLTLAYDKFTMAALFLCVLICFDEGRQRRFLLVLAVLKFYEYTISWGAYNEAFFVDLQMMQNIALGCSVLSGIAWIAPTIGGGSNTVMTVPQAPKMKAT